MTGTPQPVPPDRQLLLAWGSGTTAPTPPCSLDALIWQAVAAHPTATAVRCCGQAQTYAEFGALAETVAARLRELGAGPGATVAVSLNRTLATPAALAGVLRSGAAYVPIDPGLPPARAGSMLADAAPVAMLVDGAAPPSSAVDLPCLSLADLHAVRLPSPPVSGPADLAYVLFTSGSTGRPKGVCVEHGSVVDFVVHNAVAYGVGPGTRMLAMAGLGFDVSVAELFTALTTGATVVLAGEHDRATPEAVTDLLRRERVTVAELPPALLAHLDPQALPDLRLVSVGGEAPSARQVTRWVHAGKQVINAYGPTETTVSATLMACTGRDGTDVPIGRPMANHTAYVLDHTGALAPLGEAGELAIAGPGVARGYLGAPEETAQRFGPDPFAPGRRLYRTGDRAAWNDDGTLRFLGRIDEQMNLRGHRIEAGEVEARLRAHSDVADAVAVVRDDGSGPSLVGYVIEQAPVSAAELTRWLADYLPAYMHPSSYHRLDAFALTPTGKVDRAALAARVEATTIDAGQPPTVEAPRDELERAILDCWREALPTAGPFGVHDHLADLGGHSLLAMVLLGRLHRLLGVRLRLSELGADATVAGVAALVRARPATDSDRPTGAPRASAVGPRTSAWTTQPASPGQRRLWSAEQLTPGTATYHLPVSYRLRGALDVAAFRRALALVTERHEMLRACYRAQNGELGFRVEPQVTVPLSVVDLSQLRGHDREAAARRACEQTLGTPFDLQRAPLWRAVLIRLEEHHHVVCLVLHHAIADGWSLSILLHEIGQAYAGHSAQLPTPTLTYGDYATSQIDRQASPQAGAELAEWTRILAGAPQVLDLPTDRPRPSRINHDAATATTRIPTPVAQRVRALAARRRSSDFPVLLGAFALLLGRLTATRDVVVSCPVANRIDSGTESMVGLLVETVPVRVRIGDAHATAGDLVDECIAAVRQAQDHAQVPFDRIVDALRPTRDPGRASLAQVGFNLLNYPDERLTLPGIDARVYPVAPSGSLLDLTVYLREIPGGGWDVEAVYRRDLFDMARVTAMLDAYLGVLRQVVDDEATTPLAEITLRTPATAVVLPDEAAALPGYDGPSVLERFAHLAVTAPGRAAVNDMSYSEVAAAVTRVAAAVRDARTGSGDVVAIAAGRTAELPIALLGVLASGATAHLVDLAQPVARAADALRCGGGSVWLPLDEDTPTPEVVRTAGWQRLPSVAQLRNIAGPATSSLAPFHDPRHPAFILNTSGSTGVAKAVVSTGLPLAHFVDWYAGTFALSPTDRFAATSAVAHDPILRDLLVPLAIGASVHLAPPSVHRSPALLLSWLEETEITVLHVTPQLGRLLVGAGTATGITLPRLRVVVTGGDLLRGADVALLRALAPDAAIIAGYGATETPQLAGWQPAVGERHRERVPLGRGISGVQLLVRTDTGAPAGVGEPGEILVRSRFLANGYADGGEAERFEAEPDGVRRYRTGDRGRYLPDGRVEFLGRADGQVKVRGFRIELTQLADALLAVPGVTDAVAVPDVDPDGETSLTAYVVGDRALSDNDIRRQLRSRLIDAAIPRDIRWLDALPRTANGKVDRAALHGLPHSTRPAPTHTRPAAVPATIERAVAEAWRAVLDRADVGVDDNFFDVGGTSLRLLEVQARLRDLLDRPVGTVDLFHYPTIRSLAVHLAQGDLPNTPEGGRTPPRRRRNRRAA